MIKRTTVKNINSCVKIGKRGVSVFLAVLLVVSTFVITPFIANADDSLTVNYPLLRELSDKGPKGDNWTYGVHDYAEKPDFKTSDISFLAPKTEIVSGGVKLTWSSFGGADNYTINIYDSTNALCYEKTNVTSTEITVPSDEFQHSSYQVQLVAFSGTDELAASMVRPFEYKEAVSEAELLTNLGGNVQSGGGRFWADETNDSIALNKAPVDKLHGHTLGKSACFWFNTIGKLPSDTQAIAFWYSQKIPADGSYYALRFQLAWQTPTGLTLSGNPTAYFIPADSTNKTFASNVVPSGGAAGYTILDADRKNGEYVEGWVVFPLSNYNDASKTKLINEANTNLRIYWATEKSLVNADGTINASATNGDNRRHYVSELHAISDVNAFLDLYKGEVDNSYAASAQRDYECDTFNDSKEYYNKNSSENRYVLSSNAASFTMTDNALGTKGMRLEFSADEAGYYDLSQELSVTGNASSKGNVYYRVLRLSDNKIVYPKENQWQILNVNGNNPKASLAPVTTYLAKGDKLRIEAYTRLTSGDKITINIGNPTTTLTDYVLAGSGEYLSYKSYDYFLSARDIETPYYTNDRFEFYMLDYSDSMTNPSQKEFTKYNKSWTNSLYYNVNTPIIGLWGMGGIVPDKRIKFKAAANHGPQITYNVFEDGYLDIYVPITMEGEAEIDVRVVKNNEQLWPLNGFATVTSAEIKLNTDVKIGDEIKVQFYSDSEKEVGGFTDAVISHSVTEPKNLSVSEVYSPLWERPYGYKTNYSGEYKETKGSMFNFSYTDNSTSNTMNYFDAKKNFLYNTDKPDSGYTFGKDDLSYTISDKTSGMYLSFTAPYTGKYDLSTAFKVVSGSGTSKLRITKGDSIIWPENGAVYEFSAKPDMKIEIPAIQVNLKSGEKLNIILTSEVENGTDLVVNFGTPVIYRFANSTYSGSETIDIYSPYKFTAFEKGSISDRKAALSRFEYAFVNAKGKENLAKIYNDSEKSATLNGTGFKFTETGAVTVDVKDSALTHILRFTAPKDITGKLQFEVSGSGNATIRLLKNGKQIWPENGLYNATSEIVPVELDAVYLKGDKIEWQVKADSAATVELGVPNITDVYHATDYDENTISYYALYGNPFADKEFTGKYKRYDNELWLYDIANVSDIEDIEYIIPDKYDSENGKYLYNSETATGYYFKEILEAELKNSDSGKYGVSLGFKAPRTDSFVFRTGLRIATENATAKLYSRIIKNGEVIWCGNADNGWYSDTVVSGVNIDIPLNEIELTTGDIVRLEIFAEDITIDSVEAEKINISLVSPEIFSEAAKNVSDPNIEAKVLYTYDEFPYFGIAYTGKYTSMENRWNYEFAEFSDTVNVFDPDYYDGKTVDLYSSAVSDTPHYKLNTKTVVLTPAADSFKGINLRYTAAKEAETIFQIVPKIISGAGNGNVKFRILNNGERVWPKDTEWETLTAENYESVNPDRLNLDLSVGDNVEIQLYAEAIEGSNGDITVELDTFAAVVGYKQETKRAYNLVKENTVPQLDPFWSYEYTINPVDIKWKRASQYGNSYHNIPNAAYNGVQFNNGIFGLTICSGLLELCEAEGGTVPIVSATLTVPSDGFYKIGANKARIYAESDMIPKIRITVNGEKVWPEDKQWEIIETEVDSFSNSVYELKTGDKLRFEVSADDDYETFINKNRFRIMWPVSLSYSEWDIVYTETKDIFNMLTPEMHDFYLSLLEKQGIEFDEEYDKHYEESLLPDDTDSSDDDTTSSDTNTSSEPTTSENTGSDDNNGESSIPPTNENTQSDTSSTVQSDTSNNSSIQSSQSTQSETQSSEITSSYENTTSGSEGMWVEGTEDQVIVTPGKRKKTVKHYVYYQYPVLAIVLISIGAVLVIAGVVILILHKKGKINWFRKRKTALKKQ